MKTNLVIEFSERWIKAVVFLPSVSLKRAQIKQVILEPIEQDTVSFSAALSRIIKQINAKKDLEVRVVISRNKLTVRRLDLPSRDTMEIQQMLGLHVIRQVPYTREEIVWGYQNLGFDGISNSRILLAIAHRQILRSIFNAFLALDILPEAMLMSSQGTAHYLYEALKDKALLQEACLVLDIDYNYSDFILVHNQAVRSDVVISQGAELLKSDPERARFIAELRQAMAVFNNEIPQVKPAKFILTGACLQAQQWLPQILEREFNLKAQVVSAQEIAGLGVKNAEDISFSAVLGFSYQRKREDISFTLPEAQIKKEIKVKLRQLLIIGGLLTYIFVLLGALTLVKLGQLQSYRDKLYTKVAKLKQGTGELSDIAAKISVSRQYWAPAQSALTYIYELTRLCPANITMTNFNWEWQKSYTVRGYGAQTPDIFNFVNLLDSSEAFKGIQTRSTRRRTVKGKETVDFELGKK